MAISEATIQELRQILKEDYAKNLTQAEVAKLANDLVGYFNLLAKIQGRIEDKNDYDNEYGTHRQPSTE